MSSTVDAEAPADDLRSELLASLETGLGDALVGSHLKPGLDLWVRVEASAWVRAHELCRSALAMDSFCFVSAIDWMPSPFGRGEDDPTAPPVERDSSIRQGYAGGETRFQVLSRVHSTTRHVGVTLKADVGEAMVIDTLRGVYAGADWHERELWEMFGIDVAGHPNLVHLYLPVEFEGHPLRKDFPLLARIVKPWPGIVDVEPMPGSDDDAEAEAS